MERTESVVVQVGPQFENEKIHEMQQFGWNLQGRQEIHQEGDAYGRPSYLSNSTYVVKTKVKQYVKLHFARSVSAPNLEQIKTIEAEYNALPFPAPPSLVGPIALMVFFTPGFLGSFALMTNSVSDGVGMFFFAGIPVALGFVWLKSRLAGRAQAATVRTASGERAKILL